MIGNAMRFKLKKTLVGVAALSVLCPMASHADVTPGRWIFDGLGRSTRDGQGSTCVGAGGDTHAFDAVNCSQSASELKSARDAEIAAKKAVAEAKAAAKAEAHSTARTALPGGQIDGHVSRSTGTRLLDGFGRDCIRDGSGLTPSSPNCSPAPSTPAPRAPAPVVEAAPVEPGSSLAAGSRGAYVGHSAGTEIRDGYGRSCIKDGRWHPGLANEECDPGLFSAWRSSQPAPIELAKRVKSAPPEVKWPPEQPAPAPAPAPAPEPTAMAAAPTESSVVDNSLPVFPVTTYALPTDAESDDVDALAADDDDEMDEALADGTDAADDDDTGVAMLADPDDADATEDEAPVAALDEDDDDTVAAFADDDDDDDDDSDETAASGGDDIMRDDENMAFAALGDVDDEDDDDAGRDDDDEDDLADVSETGVDEADDSLALAALADTDGDGEPDDEALLEDDEPVMADDDTEDDTGSRVADSDLAPRIASRPPEAARLAPAAVVAKAPEGPAEFPVTKYEYDASAATADTGASALAAAPEEQEPLADGPAEPAATASVAPPQDTPAVAAATAVPAEPKAAAEVASPEVACPPVTIQLEGARFDFDKWVLRPQAKEKLDDVAAKLKSHQCEAIEIIGHTDRIGTAKYNQRLSERRANAARDYLIKHHGIEADRVTASGKGESELITKASDCRGKRKKALIACYGPDRRIEVKVRK